MFDELVKKGTPMVLGENLTWVSRSEWKQQQSKMLAVVKNWEKDWESLDYSRYIRNYASNFSDGKKSFKAFAEHKRRVNSSKSFIDINLKDLSIYTYPDSDLMVVSFNQHYKSSNYKGEGLKRQYWQKSNNAWKIAFEGDPSLGIP